jgi:hypothetical protein
VWLTLYSLLKCLSKIAFYAIAVALKKLFEPEAKERQGHRSDIKEKLPECGKGQSRDKAVKPLGVSVFGCDPLPLPLPNYS